MSVMMTLIVSVIVLFAALIVLFSFINIYRNSTEQSAITSSDQAVVQVNNIVSNYTDNISTLMELIQENMNAEELERDEFLSNMIRIQNDVVAIILYDQDGTILNCWSGDYQKKESPIKDLSYYPVTDNTENELCISSPHVESLLEGYYPWVVTMTQTQKGEDGYQIAMDIRFSSIANYVDDVGIGQHGYCFIIDGNGNMIYHPQQQLIYSGLKEEHVSELGELEDGAHVIDDVIYSIKTIENYEWRIIGVSFVDELITNRVSKVVNIVVLILLLVMLTAVVAGVIFSASISTPANRLAEAMGAFEHDAENFRFENTGGTSEIASLSDSFGHMVIRVQELMDQVRQEEISLRKTELNALQAQINPHFLYNTLDSISWMCEEGRTEEAVEMVNALAKLFRISISKGHELIPLSQELQHVESYLKIQKYRYKNQFSYHFQVDKSCLVYYCNKITLQPIVENSIYHGLDMIDEGRITIGICDHGEDILLYVEDNGVGMSSDKCSEILRREPGDKSGIGIKNVHDRIKIYFGDKYGLTITSEPDEGTRVEILIPKLTEDEYEKR